MQHPQYPQTTFQAQGAITDTPFPSGCHNRWLTAEHPHVTALSPTLQDWLLDSGSLTARLKASYRTVRVIVLREETACISEQERELFDTPSQLITVREILLLGDGIARVFARTLLPQNTLEQASTNFRQLGDKPLGEILFQTTGMRRGPIEVSAFEPASGIGTLARQLGQSMPPLLWGRRSLFYIDQQPLSVAEIFLPASSAYPQLSTEREP